MEGIGAEVNLVFPLGSHLADVPALVNADANICLYREFGRLLCEALERPTSRRPSASLDDAVPAGPGRSLGLDPEPFIARRSTPRSSRSGIYGAR